MPPPPPPPRRDPAPPRSCRRPHPIVVCPPHVIHRVLASLLAARPSAHVFPSRMTTRTSARPPVLAPSLRALARPRPVVVRPRPSSVRSLSSPVRQRVWAQANWNRAVILRWCSRCKSSNLKKKSQMFSSSCDYKVIFAL